MNVNKKGPIVDPGMCRCCGMQKKCRLLNYEYDWMGNKEIYEEMFVECFGLVLSQVDCDEMKGLICATCVVRLRDAVSFRHQVLRCEEQMLKSTLQIHEDVADKPIKMELDLKQERQKHGHCLGDVSDDHHDGDEYGDTTVPEYEPAGEVKSESALSSETKTRKLRSCLRTSVVDGVGSKKLKTTHEIDVYKKVKKVNEKLKKPSKSNKTLTYCIEPNFKRPPVIDKEINAIKNVITIVENSYVTPFIASFSDFTCVYCREMFIDPDKLRKHTLEHDPRIFKTMMNNKKMSMVDIEKIDCRLCQTQIDNIDTFKEHITSVHNKVIYKDVDTEFIKFKLKTGKLNCLECGKTFDFFQALKKHMAMHFGAFICDICGAHYFEERALFFHKKTHSVDKNVEMFPCTECEKTFRSKNSRNFHVSRIHRNEPAYPCNKCDEIFLSYHMRYRHKMHVHGEKREFPCEDCEKVYYSRKTLREHHQRTHLQLLRHECTFCDKKFYLPSALRDHMTTHTGERLYRCDYCGKTYPRKKALTVHLQSHNTEKKYKCSLCPSAYTQANNFKNHMKSKHPNPAQYIEGYS